MQVLERRSRLYRLDESECSAVRHMPCRSWTPSPPTQRPTPPSPLLVHDLERDVLVRRPRGEHQDAGVLGAGGVGLNAVGGGLGGGGGGGGGFGEQSRGGGFW